MHKGDQQKQTASKPRFYHRLAFRFALILALAMVAFDHLAGYLHQAVFEAFGLPHSIMVEEGIIVEEGIMAELDSPDWVGGNRERGNRERGSAEGIPGNGGMEEFLLLSRLGSSDLQGLAGLEPGDAPVWSMAAHLRKKGQLVASQLLEGSTKKAEGQFVPSTEAVEATGEWIRGMGFEFLWAAADGTPLASSRPEQMSMGNALSQAATSDHMRWWPIAAPTSPGEDPVSAPGLAGWVAIWPSLVSEVPGLGLAGWAPPDRALVEGFPPGFGLEDGVVPLLVPAEEADGILNRMRMVANLTFWVSTLLLALLLSALLSWLVTSRVSRLSTAVVAMGSDAALQRGEGAEDPLPMRLVSGRDEVGLLAKAFVESRERIFGLLHTLSQRDRTRREWVAHASHDLRTPLTALSACLDRIQSLEVQGGPEHREQLACLVDSARSDCVRLHELTDDLLSLARLEASDAFQPEPLLAGELTSRVYGSLLPLAESKGIELAVDLGQGRSDDLTFEGQGRSILRVLENLVRNAIQHASQSVCIQVKRVQSEQQVVEGLAISRHDGPAMQPQERIQGPYLLFEVLDDGPGFGPDSGSVESANGLQNGIGLRIVERFLEMHGGWLETTNWEGGGRAAFALPASQLEESSRDRP